MVLLYSVIQTTEILLYSFHAMHCTPFLIEWGLFQLYIHTWYVVRAVLGDVECTYEMAFSVVEFDLSGEVQ